MGNPAVFFDDDTPPNRPVLRLDGRVHIISDEELWLTDDLDDPNCDDIPPARYKNLKMFVGYLEGQHFLFDPQSVLLENSFETPLPDGGGTQVEQTRMTKTEIKNDGSSYQYEVSATGEGHDCCGGRGRSRGTHALIENCARLSPHHRYIAATSCH